MSDLFDLLLDKHHSTTPVDQVEMDRLAREHQATLPGWKRSGINLLREMENANDPNQ